MRLSVLSLSRNDRCCCLNQSLLIAMLLTSLCHQFCRTLSLRARHISKLSPFTCQQVYLSSSTVRLFHGHVSKVPDAVQKKLRTQYNLSDDYFVIYKEPKPELNHMVILKCLELFVYISPLLVVGYNQLQKKSFLDFIGQEDFYIGIFIVCVYMLGIRFVANGFVKIIFYNPVKDVYRAYVLNKYRPTYKFVEFKSQDLKVINLSPSIPMARNFFKTGKQNLILHDDLFSSSHEQDKLIGNAIEMWHARWGK